MHIVTFPSVSNTAYIKQHNSYMLQVNALRALYLRRFHPALRCQCPDCMKCHPRCKLQCTVRGCCYFSHLTCGDEEFVKTSAISAFLFNALNRCCLLREVNELSNDSFEGCIKLRKS